MMLNNLNTFRKTLLRLEKKEINSLIIFLKSYKDLSEETSKSILLIQLLLEQRDCTATQIQQVLYGGNNFHALNKLIIRLNEKMCDIILLDSNLKSKEIYSKRNMVFFEMK